MFAFLNQNKKLRIVFYSLILLFALVGFVFSAVFFAVKFNLTKQSGSIDFNDRFFKELSEKEYKSVKDENQKNETQRKALLYSKILILNNFYPQNAALILNSFVQNQDVVVAEKMFDALQFRLADNKEYQKLVNEEEKKHSIKDKTETDSKQNLFEWMNTEEWEVLKASILKDKKLIDSVEKVTGVKSRMIVSLLIGEQIRLFHSSR